MPDKQAAQTTAIPYSGSYQRIPEDLFILARLGHIDYRQFFLLATFHKLMQYRDDGTVIQNLEILSERTGIKARTLFRNIKGLVQKKLLYRWRSDIKNAEGYAVNEYAVNWTAIQRIAAPERENWKKQEFKERAEKQRKEWECCPTCEQPVSPYKIYNGNRIKKKILKEKQRQDELMKEWDQLRGITESNNTMETFLRGLRNRPLRQRRRYQSKPDAVSKPTASDELVGVTDDSVEF